ncbi:NCS2 family permease [Propionicimonas sp.]|uniref:NCS2 family permease n=1 Tax=Propionicimonas sp. TaxID=1955623 RepID=UPI0039E4F832
MANPGTTSAAPAPQTNKTIDNWFELSKRGSTMGREVRGGLVTFFTMAYIIILNPIIIGTQVDVNGNLITGVAPSVDGAVATSMAMVAAATALIAGIMTIIMGVYGRFPIALATGLGLNALVAYTIVKQMTWPQAMGLIVWEGVLITILVLTGFRKAIFDAVPRSMRSAISVGIGLFIAFIGLVDGGVVRAGSGTPVQLGVYGELLGWPIAIFLIGLALIVALYIRRVKGALLIAILSATIIAVVVQAVLNLPLMKDATGAVVNPTGWIQNLPALTSGFTLPNLGLLGRVDMFGAFTSAGGAGAVIGILLLIFSLLLSDFFDTMGTIVAVGAEGGLLQGDGNPPYTQEILLVDSVAAIAGGVGSVSSATSYIESASGVGEGARTGIASVVTGIAFLLTLFLAPLVEIVPAEAATPALFFVGFLMMSQVVHVDWDEPEEGIPAFLTIVLMPFTYSITTGIGAGFIAFALIKALKGKAKDVHPLMWVVVAAFVLYFGQGIITGLIS